MLAPKPPNPVVVGFDIDFAKGEDPPPNGFGLAATGVFVNVDEPKVFTVLVDCPKTPVEGIVPPSG